MLGATRTPLFSILKSQSVNNTRVGNKADMGLFIVNRLVFKVFYRQLAVLKFFQSPSLSFEFC